MFEIIRSALETVKNESQYDQLTLYNGVFMLIYDQRASMASVNMDKEEILTLLETVYKSAKALSVQKEQSKKLQDEVLLNYEQYKEAIERIYTNKEERN